MFQESTYSIIGGDTRQIYLFFKLIEAGYSCTAYGLPAEEIQRYSLNQAASLPEALIRSKYVLGPVPLSQNGLISGSLRITTADFIDLMQEGQYLFAGCIDDTVRTDLAKKKVRCFDYMKSDEIALFNSIATAEGMLAEAIINYPGNLHKSRCLIIGYGRCGRTLADKLKGIGADVTICARKEESLTAAYCMGFNRMRMDGLKESVGAYDMIFNSAPELVLTSEILSSVSAESYIFDLASKPGGVDWQAAKEKKIHAGLYLGLPGKYSPASSAEALYSYVLSKQFK